MSLSVIPVAPLVEPETLATTPKALGTDSSALGGSEKWQEILADLVTEPKELLQILELNPDSCPPQEQLSLSALMQFPLKAPRPFVARIEKGNWQDPLFKQLWPGAQEQLQRADFVKDPLQEQASNPLKGLLHKYQGRVLLTVAPHCAIHCRYCFRRHFDYKENTPSRVDWQQVIDYIAADPSIEEVIYSGGDPLAAPDRQLSWLSEAIAAIPHVITLRIHSRLPVVIPQRVNSELLAWMTASRLQVVMVIHCNHENELDDSVAQALTTLRENGVHLLNQTILLKGINDNLAVLAGLSKRLFSLGVLPYYLHMPDKVQGTSHFYVPDDEALALMNELRQCVPGYLMPRLVRENPGEKSKTTLV